MKAFRPLILFWLGFLVVAAGIAGTLEYLGPLPGKVSKPPEPSRGPPVQARRIDLPAVPARVAPSTLDPAPALKMRLAAIPDPDAALLEPAEGLPGRMLPRPDGAGRLASVVYAAAFDPAERHPRITLVVDGAGLDRALTEQANGVLPAAVDFSYSAYAPAEIAAKLAAAGRKLGRECLVSVPMEPNGFPASDEGTRALLTGNDPGQNRQDLDWALSSVQGCVGATGGSDGLRGERFAEGVQSFGDMLTLVAQRGLDYLDPRPGAPAPADGAQGRRMPYVVDVVADRVSGAAQPADAQAIDNGLGELEQVAARKGSAIGLAGPLTPVLIDRILVWSQGLAARGFVLAPLTAMPVPETPQFEPAR